MLSRGLSRVTRRGLVQLGRHRRARGGGGRWRLEGKLAAGAGAVSGLGLNAAILLSAGGTTSDDALKQFKQASIGGGGGGAGGGNGALGRSLSRMTAELVGAGALFSLLLLGYGVSRFKKCSPNQVLVIFGKTNFRGGVSKPVCVHGGGALIWPVIQDYAFLSLKPLSIEIDLRKTLTKHKLRVNVPSCFTVAVGTEPELMQNAAQRLLFETEASICRKTEEIIYGQLRDVIASLSIEEINGNRALFSNKVSEHVETELVKLGLRLINVNFTDVTDEAGVIEALGSRASADAIETARVDVAEKVKMGSVGEATQNRERDIVVAQERATTQIGISKAQLELETETTLQQRDMRVRVAMLNSESLEGENEAEARIKMSNAVLKCKEAEAYQAGEVKHAEADGAVEEARAHARTRAALADAKRVEAEKYAELVAPAKAKKEQLVVQAEAEAQQRVLEAEAEAKSTFLMLKAQADGEYASMKAQADGFSEIVKGCGSAQNAFQLMMLDHVDRLAETTAKAVSNIKFDKVIVWDGGNSGGGGGAASGGQAKPGQSNGGAGTATADFIRNVATSLPPLLDVMKNAGGVDMPEYFGKLMNPQVKGEPVATMSPSEQAKISEMLAQADNVEDAAVVSRKN